MCGICGVVSMGGLPPGATDWVREMSDVLRHRGPDDAGHYSDRTAAIGMRRLSVIDVADGHQPIANEDKTVWIVFNGEIYNHQKVRRDLVALGHRFRTHSDTEVIVHAYEEYGTDCPEHLNGMFAFAIWDTRHQRLFAARDRIGQKPFFYALHKNQFCFGSELKALLQIPGLAGEMDPVALHHFLSLQYVPDSHCIYRGIQKLPAAHWLTFENGDLLLARYWTPNFEPKTSLDQTEAAEELRRLLTQSVQRRMIADVPYGAFLSGGLDSSIIVGLMAGQSRDPVKTFSIGFENEALNELPYARAVADHWQTEHREFIVKPDEFDVLLPKLADAFDEPFADSSAFQTYYLAKETRQHVTVALNGDGADEIFAGYPRYWLDRYIRAYAALPDFVTQRLVPALVDRLPEPSQTAIEANWVLGLKRLAQASRISPKASILRWGSYFDEPLKSQLYKEKMRALTSGQDTSRLLEHDFEECRATTDLDRTLSVDMRNYLCGNILVKADRMTMAHGLEARSPFLDHEVVEFAASLPAHYKLRGRNGKHILRNAFQGSLPQSVQNRPKRGFGAPVESWLRTELRSAVHDLLLSPSAKLGEYFSRDTMAKMVAEHESRKCDHGRRIWSLLMLEVWLRQCSKAPSFTFTT